jgi:hypothetical protein
MKSGPFDGTTESIIITPIFGIALLTHLETLP